MPLQVISVSETLDLVAVTFAFSRDHQAQFEQELTNMKGVREDIPALGMMYQFSPEYMSQVVEEALQFRGQMSPGVRDSLNRAINKSDIRLNGFRDTSKADADRLAEPVFGRLFLQGKEQLLESVLMGWMEYREDLRAQVAQALSRLGIPTDGLGERRDEGIGIWEREEDWTETLRTVQSEIGDADELDVRLMMTCVSGMAPDLPEELKSEMLRGWMEKLRELPADAPEWSEMKCFVRQMEELAIEKAGEMIREQAERLESVIEDTQKEFGDELVYLEIDLSRWLGEAREHPVIFPEATLIAEALHNRLLEYKEVFPRAAKTRSEELQLRALRED